ncbi:hypothetical protein KSP40_PGU004646 [Platanthera guangdongensis]|uniref:Uncharacterized protein n=1 Tax=Platanthera guangdongensis TaxID=2320717 RepID=A0ABR2MVF7_9ASPA
MPSSTTIPFDLDEEQVNSDEEDNIVANSRTQTSLNVDTGGSEHASKFLGSSSKKTSRKRKGSGEVACRQAVAPPPISVTIKEAVEEICRIPDIYDDPDFFDFAMEFIRIKSGREAFMFCPADRKDCWISTMQQHQLAVAANSSCELTTVLTSSSAYELARIVRPTTAVWREANGRPAAAPYDLLGRNEDIRMVAEAIRSQDQVEQDRERGFKKSILLQS